MRIQSGIEEPSRLKHKVQLTISILLLRELDAYVVPITNPSETITGNLTKIVDLFYTACHNLFIPNIIERRGT